MRRHQRRIISVICRLKRTPRRSLIGRRLKGLTAGSDGIKLNIGKRVKRLTNFNRVNLNVGTRRLRVSADFKFPTALVACPILRHLVN